MAILAATGWASACVAACGAATQEPTDPTGTVACTSPPGDWPSDCVWCAPVGSGEETPVSPRPSRACVRAIVERRRGDILACLPEPPPCRPVGVEVELTADGATGEVRELTLPDDVPPEQASCIADALQAVRLPPFAEPEMRIRYRFDDLGGSCRAIGPAGDGSDFEDEDLVAMAEAIRGLMRPCLGSGDRAAARTASVRLDFGVTGRITRIVVTGDFTGAATTCTGAVLRALTLPADVRGPAHVEFTFDIFP